MTGIKAPGHDPHRSGIVPDHKPAPINTRAAWKYGPWYVLGLGVFIALVRVLR